MNDKETQLLDRFKQLTPQLESWGSYVDRSLVEILDEEFIKTNLLKIKPSFRLKDQKSFLYKAFYRRKKYTDPIHEIEDKAGTRIVMLKSDDISKVRDMIMSSDKWQSKETKSIQQEIEDQPKIFDYQSVHVVVWPNDEMQDQYGDNIPNLTCEIQIRTLLQHAFAEVSHDSAYKGPYKNDSDILRHLSKSMALMEATDDYFCEIFKMMADDTKKYKAYLNELVRLYREFNPGFSRQEINLELTELVMGLLEQKEISINDLEAFIEKRKRDLYLVLKQSNGLIFQQPISLLVGYYIFKHQIFLINNWPLNIEVLKEVFMVFGFSTDNISI